MLNAPYITKTSNEQKTATTIKYLMPGNNEHTADIKSVCNQNFLHNASAILPTPQVMNDLGTIKLSHEESA
jgi:hypothetical protein